MTYEEYSKKRNALGLTDYAVSSLTKISRATLSQWKNGNTVPSLNTAQRLNYLLNNYDPTQSYPENYFVIKGTPIDYYIPSNNIPDNVINTLTDEMLSEANKPQKPSLRIDGYYINIGNGIPVELSEADYTELKKSTEAYALAWLQTHGKLSDKQ